MMTKENNDPIGKEILSIAFGVGIISGVETLQEGGDDYYVVEYGAQNSKNYFPVKDNKKTRFMSTEEEFLKNIKKLKNQSITKKFDSRKDRITYFNVVLGDCRLAQVVERILEIKSLDDLVVNEKDKLSKLIAVLEAEASIIYDMTTAESKKFIADHLLAA